MYSPKVIRSTMGAAFRMSMIAIENNVSDIKKMIGFFGSIPIFVATLEDSPAINKIKVSSPFGLIVGNESHGVSSSFKELDNSCLFHIPGSGTGDSLNVAVATGIALYELTGRCLLPKHI